MTSPGDHYQSTDVRIGKRPVVYDAVTCRFTLAGQRDPSGRSIEDLRVAVADEAETKAEERALAETRKAELANPIPVTVVPAQPKDPKFGPTALAGDYLLRGWHRTNRTPLLGKADGTSAGFTPSELSHALVLDRLNAVGWAEYQRLTLAYLTAQQRLEGTGRAPVKLATDSKGMGMAIEVRLPGTHLRPGEHVATVAYRVEGENLVAEVDGVVIREPYYFALALNVAHELNPDNGKPCVLIDTENDNEATPGVFHSKTFTKTSPRSRYEVLFDTTVEEVVTAKREFEAAHTARVTFLDKHRRLH